MEVTLYVYDLSRGLARTMSAALIGIQIEAVYHTSIVLEGIEYVYDGGIQLVEPGKTHLGPPWQVKHLGTTTLPLDVIMDYLESLKSIYTAAAYDLWRHNCNNFSNDFATFLIGKGIPEHITNLPATVLDSPFGRMIQPTIDDMVRNGRNRRNGLLGIADDNIITKQAPETSHQRAVGVKTATSVIDLDRLLASAQATCAVVHFTLLQSVPCRSITPIFNDLAKEAQQRAVFIKVDIGVSQDIAKNYSIHTTPTVILFLKGIEQKRWSGSDPQELCLSIRKLLETACPPHPHESLQLPILRQAAMKPVLHSKVPPLDKLLNKMGQSATHPAVKGVKDFISAKVNEGAAEATLPDLSAFSVFIADARNRLPPEIMFTVTDLFRTALADARVSGYYAEEEDHKTVASLLDYVNKLEKCPYSLRLVALQTGLNLFSSPLYVDHILGCEILRAPIIQLITSSLLDGTNSNVRVAAASLAFNIASANSKVRRYEYREVLPEEVQVELAASLLEAIAVEKTSSEALRGLLLAFGCLLLYVPEGGELVDLVKSMDAQVMILRKKEIFPNEALVLEVGRGLLGPDVL